MISTPYQKNKVNMAMLVNKTANQFKVSLFQV